MMACDAHNVAAPWAASVAVWRLGRSGHSGDGDGDSGSSCKCNMRVALLRQGGAMGACDGDEVGVYAADNTSADVTAE